MSHIPPPVMQNPPPPHPPPLLASPQIPGCGMNNSVTPPWAPPPCPPPLGPSHPMMSSNVPPFSRPPLWDPRVPPPAPRMMPPPSNYQVPPPLPPLVHQSAPRPCPPPLPTNHMAPLSSSCPSAHNTLAPMNTTNQWHQQQPPNTTVWKHDAVTTKHWSHAQEQPPKNQPRFSGSQYSSHSNPSYEPSAGPESHSWYYSRNDPHSQPHLEEWDEWGRTKQQNPIDKDQRHFKGTRRDIDLTYDKHHQLRSTKRPSDYDRRRSKERSRNRSRSRSRSRGRSPERRRRRSRENLRRRSRSRSESYSRSRSRHQERSRRENVKDPHFHDECKTSASCRSRTSEKSSLGDHSPDRLLSSGDKIISRNSSHLDDDEGDAVDGFEERDNKLPEEDDDELQKEARVWTRCSPADLYFTRSSEDPKVLIATEKLRSLHENFKTQLLDRAEIANRAKPKYEPPPRKIKLHPPKVPREKNDSSSSSCDESDSEEEDNALEEMEKKKKHPYRLHEELWFNDPGEMNDGPLCRCSAKARRSGIRHGIYPGEEHLPPCNPNSNNINRLHHYRITMSPHTNFLTKSPTIIKHDGHEFIFEGFSLFSHEPLGQLPICKVIRFNIEYTILYLEERFPENIVVESLELFSNFLFREILELVDLDWKAHCDVDGCPRFHFMPRFARSLEDNGKELLSMNVVLQYLLKSNAPLLDEKKLVTVPLMSQYEWQEFADNVKSMIVTYPGMKPCSLRVDQLDREGCDPKKGVYPVIVHFGIRPPQLSYAGNPSYQKAWRDYVKFRHLLANKPKVEYVDRHKLLQKEMRLQEMRMKSNLKRDVTVVVSSKGFFKTGIMCDIVQHAMLLPVLVCHLRFHQSLNLLETKISHKFVERYLLQLALTHPSYRENFGTNPDHARNSLTNCGIRQPEYGDRRIHYLNTRKRGINTLINIMSRFGRREETNSNINHNERLEFLGDAVVEFLSSIHLFHMFPDLEEGGLATYRAAIVQNQHLAVLAKKLQLDQFMLYAHGSDLCHDLELRHAMANCFEALMGALFLDSGIEVADRVFSHTLFSDEDILDVWVNYPPHPLQEQAPEGDRCWIEAYPLLKKMHEFEVITGIAFNHIRLLARAFTHRSVGFNNLTLGSNERLEFLGDTVLQLVASEYLYKYFPEHHEGHLSLLRSSLVNNRTQAVVCDDLGMVDFANYPYPKGELKTKDRADLLEAFLGALYVDKGLEHCRVFCQVCFFPRLQDFIMNQDWNDPKSKLQQCCLTLRTMDGGEPDIPVYKVIECKGPTNTRVYTVAVYFRGERLATGSGHSIQQAEMAAAEKALESSKELFPQLIHQRRVIERSLKQQGKRRGLKEDRNSTSRGRSQDTWYFDSHKDEHSSKERKARIESKIPASYRITRTPEKSRKHYDSDKSEGKNSSKEKSTKKEKSKKDYNKEQTNRKNSDADETHSHSGTET